MIQVKLVDHTPDPELAVVTAARTCMQNADYEAVRAELREEGVKRILRTVILKNHHSVLEHVNFTFAISGVSRVLSHQLVRHRIASYSQLSQQRTDSSYLKFTIPPEINHDPELAEEYESMMIHCRELYRRFIQCGVSRSSARYILPAGFTTRIIATMNARSLFNLLAQRECKVEEWEFRQVAYLMHAKLMKVAPNIFSYAGPKCVTDLVCPEGKKGEKCGLYKKIPGVVLRDGFDVDASKQLLNNPQTGFSVVGQFQADKRNHSKKTLRI